MGKIFRIVFIILFAVMSTGFISILKADAEEGTCVLDGRGYRRIRYGVGCRTTKAIRVVRSGRGGLIRGNPPRSQRRMPVFAIVITTSQKKISPWAVMLTALAAAEKKF